MSNPDGAPYDPEALGTEREQYPDPESYPPPETPPGETRTAETRTAQTTPMNVPGEETTDGSVPDPDITGADTDGQSS